MIVQSDEEEQYKFIEDEKRPGFWTVTRTKDGTLRIKDLYAASREEARNAILTEDLALSENDWAMGGIPPNIHPIGPRGSKATH